MPLQQFFSVQDLLKMNIHSHLFYLLFLAENDLGAQIMMQKMQEKLLWAD